MNQNLTLVLLSAIAVWNCIKTGRRKIKRNMKLVRLDEVCAKEKGETATP